jgi:hypothetical protein
MDETDHIEYEIPMLQAGAEMWRKFLAAMPHDRTPAELLMHVARLEPHALERLMFALMENPTEAKRLMSDACPPT